MPSLTETLVECGVNVVGRTRFCIHPRERVAHIQRVGGTKGVDWDKCRELKPDLVVFDREENIKEMAESCPFPWLATHMKSVADLAPELARLAEATESSELAKHADDWQQLSNSKSLQQPRFSALPGLLQPLHHSGSFERIEYIIWRDPWMAVGPTTFIGSMLAQLGFADLLAMHNENYPVLDEREMQRHDTFYLFSSEPYRFLRYHDELLEQGFNGAIVDGEVYSWFGIRSYRALNHYLNNSLD